MGINGRFRVSMADVFPAGAFVVGDVEAVRDFDKSTPERFVQAKDRETSELVWSVPALDVDESAPESAKTVVVVVKISAPVAEAVAGLPFRPVEFDGLTVTRIWMTSATGWPTASERERCAPQPRAPRRPVARPVRRARPRNECGQSGPASTAEDVDAGP